MKTTLLFLWLLTAVPNLWADEVHSLLDHYQWHKRVLVIASPEPEHTFLAQQLQLLEGQGDELLDRDLVIVQVTKGHGVLIDQKISPHNPMHFFNHLGLDDNQFYTVLIGKDGSKKLTSSRPLKPEIIYGTSEQVMNYFSLVKITCFFVGNLANSGLLPSISASKQAIFPHRKISSDLFRGSL